MTLGLQAIKERDALKPLVREQRANDFTTANHQGKGCGETAS